MKKISIVFYVCFICLFAQAQEDHGHTLNIGLGTSYGYGYYGQSFPLLLNYEFTVAKNFTLAPFISFYSYRSYYYWGNPNNNKQYKNYYYRTVAIPIGIKGTYYFDELLGASDKWDFYGALSLGFAYRRTRWDGGYEGPEARYSNSAVYAELHIGAEYHFNQKVGMFLDLSSGFSSLGVSIKTK